MKTPGKPRVRHSPIASKDRINHNYVRNRIHRRNKIMKEFKVYRCNKCKKMHIEVQGSPCPTMCCGEEMVLLKANTTDGAAEKHVPVVTVDGQKVIVNVGSVDHPMLEEHYIQFVALETAGGIQVKYLNPGEAPHEEFLTAEAPVAVYEYCNLHGLWKTEL
jgi:superoxide reductase